MGLAAIKAQSEQMTSPVALVTAVVASPYVRPNRLAFATNNSAFVLPEDSVEQRELDDDTRPDIPTNVLRMRVNKIVDKCDPEQEKKEKDQEREQNGGLTDAELSRFMVSALDKISHPAITADSFITIVPPNHTAGKKFTGSDGKSYTPILNEETGQIAYFDSGASCVMNKGGLSATTPPMVNDDLIDPSQAYNITYKVDAQGNETKRTPEDANFQLAMTRLDNNAVKLPYQLDMIDRITAEVSGATTFKSAAPSGITTDMKPAEPFATAVAASDAAPAATKSIMFKTPRTPAPWEKPAETTVALEPSI